MSSTINKFTADLIECDVPTRTGRVYPKEVIEEALNDPVLQEKLKNRALYCMLSFGDVNMKDVSHVITDLKLEDNILKAECDVLNTPDGRILNMLMTVGCTVGCSFKAYPQGIGEITLDGRVTSYSFEQAYIDGDETPLEDKIPNTVLEGDE